MTGQRNASDHSGLRLLPGYGAIAATLPYVGLKLLWLSGNLWGIPADTPAAGQEFVYANAITFAMDAVAIVLALVLTHRWGMRLPARLVIVPIWVGTGLLVPAAVQVAGSGLMAVFSGGAAITLEGGLVEPWVYVTVGTSFAAQGVLLTAAFAWYARLRWKQVFEPIARPGTGAIRSVQSVLAWVAAVMAVGIVIAHGYRLFADAGPFGDYEDGWAMAQRSNVFISGMLALTAVIGIFAMLSPLRGLTFGRAVVPTWLGAGSLFGWGMYRTVVVLSGASMAQDLTPLCNLVQSASVLAGLILGLVGILRIVERGSPSSAARCETRPGSQVTPAPGHT